MRSKNTTTFIIILSLIVGLILIGGVFTSSAVADDDEPISQHPLPPTPGDCTGEVSADDQTSETIGVVDGVTYKDGDIVEPSVVINEQNHEEVVAVTSARVESIRCLTFEESVSTEIWTQDEYKDHLDNAHEYDALEDDFNTELYRSLLFNDLDSAHDAELENELAHSIIYLSDENTIVFVENEEGVISTNEAELAYKLSLALLDQNHDLEPDNATTLEDQQRVNSVIHGDAQYVGATHTIACRTGGWEECTPVTEFIPDIEYIGFGHLYGFTLYEGASFVATIYDDGGWDDVNQLYETPPESTADVHHNELGVVEPVEVELNGANPEGEWNKLQHPTQPDSVTVGPSGMSVLLLRHLPAEITLNEAGGGDFTFDPVSPFNYHSEFITGWEGDTLEMYESSATEETGFVWTIQFEDSEDVELFSNEYQGILEREHRATEVDENTYHIGESADFSGVYHIIEDGDTLTIVQAESVSSVESLHAEANVEGEIQTEPVDDDTSDDQTGEDRGDHEAFYSPIIRFVIFAITAACIIYVAWSLFHEEVDEGEETGNENEENN